MKNKKGSAVAWAMILAGIFVITLFYLLFSQVIYGYIQPNVHKALTITNTTDTTQAVQAMAILEMVWKWWPIILVLGLIMVGFVLSQKKEPDEYYM